jgi:hypothetical protein
MDTQDKQDKSYHNVVKLHKPTSCLDATFTDERYNGFDQNLIKT